MRCRVLGPLQLENCGGKQIELAGEAQRRLASYLSLHAHQPITPVTLEDALELSPGALRTSISRLRKLVGDAALSTTPHGYLFDAQVDALDFADLVSLALARDVSHPRAQLESALGLWHGEPLNEFAGEWWADVERSRLFRLHSTACEEVAGLLLNSGLYAAALDVLQPVLDRDTYNDRPRALRTACLALSGQPTKALREFQIYRRALGQEVGTEPTRALIDLDQAIATGSDVLAALGAYGPTARAQVSSTPSATNLPAPVSTFVGRAKEIGSVERLVRDYRLVTITGLGGSGKTRLGIEVARSLETSFVGGLRWFDLGLVQAAANLPEYVATKLGVLTRPDTVGSLIQNGQTHGRCLYIMDNAEHVRTQTSALVDELLLRCPELHVLVTSREALGVVGEVAWALPVMALPPPSTGISVDQAHEYDALALFLHRASEARPAIVEPSDIAHVIDICSGLDGLPLAIELAAARTRSLALHEIAKGVGNSLQWQRSGSTLARHATLESSIRWSFSLVDEQLQRSLVWLSTFVSPFTTEAARALLGDVVGGYREILRELVDASLLEFSVETNRYRVLHTVKQFCLHREDAQSHVINEAYASHARFVASWTSEVARGEHGIEHHAFIPAMPDVVAALAWARQNSPADVFDICIGLAAVRTALGDLDDLDATWRWLLADERSADDATHWARATAALMAPATGLRYDVGPVRSEVQRFLPVDARRERGWLDRGSAMAPAYAGQLEPILDYADAILARRDDLEASVYVGFACYMLAMTGQLDTLDHYQAQLHDLTRRHETSFRVDTVGNGYAAAIIGATLRGDLQAALRLGDVPAPRDPAFAMTAAAALTQAGVFSGQASVVTTASIWAEQGTIPALDYLPIMVTWAQQWLNHEVDAAADDVHRFLDHVTAVPVALVHSWPAMNATLLAAGRSDIALSASVDVLAHAAAMPVHPYPTAVAHLIQSQTALHAGDLERLSMQTRLLLDIATKNQLRLLAVDGVESAAAAAALQCDHERAAHLVSAARSERDRIGYRFAMTPQISADAESTMPHSMRFQDAVDLARSSS